MSVQIDDDTLIPYNPATVVQELMRNPSAGQFTIGEVTGPVLLELGGVGEDQYPIGTRVIITADNRDGLSILSTSLDVTALTSQFTFGDPSNMFFPLYRATKCFKPNVYPPTIFSRFKTIIANVTLAPALQVVGTGNIGGNIDGGVLIAPPCHKNLTQSSLASNLSMYSTRGLIEGGGLCYFNTNDPNPVLRDEDETVAAPGKGQITVGSGRIYEEKVASHVGDQTIILNQIDESEPMDFNYQGEVQVEGYLQMNGVAPVTGDIQLTFTFYRASTDGNTVNMSTETKQVIGTMINGQTGCIYFKVIGGCTAGTATTDPLCYIGVKLNIVCADPAYSYKLTTRVERDGGSSESRVGTCMMHIYNVTATQVRYNWNALVHGQPEADYQQVLKSVKFGADSSLIAHAVQAATGTPFGRCGSKYVFDEVFTALGHEASKLRIPRLTSDSSIVNRHTLQAAGYGVINRDLTASWLSDAWDSMKKGAKSVFNTGKDVAIDLAKRTAQKALTNAAQHLMAADDMVCECHTVAPFFSDDMDCPLRYGASTCECHTQRAADCPIAWENYLHDREKFAQIWLENPDSVSRDLTAADDLTDIEEATTPTSSSPPTPPLPNSSQASNDSAGICNKCQSQLSVLKEYTFGKGRRICSVYSCTNTKCTAHTKHFRKYKPNTQQQNTDKGLKRLQATPRKTIPSAARTLAAQLEDAFMQGQDPSSLTAAAHKRLPALFGTRYAQKFAKHVIANPHPVTVLSPYNSVAQDLQAADNNRRAEFKFSKNQAKQRENRFATDAANRSQSRAAVKNAERQRADDTASAHAAAAAAIEDNAGHTIPDDNMVGIDEDPVDVEGDEEFDDDYAQQGSSASEAPISINHGGHTAVASAASGPVPGLTMHGGQGGLTFSHIHGTTMIPAKDYIKLADSCRAGPVKAPHDPNLTGGFVDLSSSKPPYLSAKNLASDTVYKFGAANFIAVDGAAENPTGSIVSLVVTPTALSFRDVQYVPIRFATNTAKVSMNTGEPVITGSKPGAEVMVYFDTNLGVSQGNNSFQCLQSIFSVPGVGANLAGIYVTNMSSHRVTQASFTLAFLYAIKRFKRGPAVTGVIEPGQNKLHLSQLAVAQPQYVAEKCKIVTNSAALGICLGLLISPRVVDHDMIDGLSINIGTGGLAYPTNLDSSSGSHFWDEYNKHFSDLIFNTTSIDFHYSAAATNLGRYQLLENAIGLIVSYKLSLEHTHSRTSKLTDHYEKPAPNSVTAERQLDMSLLQIYKEMNDLGPSLSSAAISKLKARLKLIYSDYYSDLYTKVQNGNYSPRVTEVRSGGEWKAAVSIHNFPTSKEGLLSVIAAARSGTDPVPLLNNMGVKVEFVKKTYYDNLFNKRLELPFMMADQATPTFGSSKDLNVVLSKPLQSSDEYQAELQRLLNS